MIETTRSTLASYDAQERSRAWTRPPFAAVAYAGAAIGASLFVAIIARQGVQEVWAALAVAGPGLLLVGLVHIAPLFTNAIGWRCLLRGPHRPPLTTVARARWIAESINSLLPVAQIGGNVVRSGLLARSGVPATTAGASVVVDITLNFATQIAFTFFGLALLVVHLGSGRLAVPVLIGAAIMSALLVAFYVSQNRGLFSRIAKLFRRWSRDAVVGDAAELEREIRRLYELRTAIAATSAWHFVSWLLGTGEVWLGLYFLGHPVGLGTALLIESLGQALRTAAFAIPGALGVQEGGFMVLGAALGVGPDVSLALSLVKRTREVLLGVPGVAVWLVEGAVASLPARNSQVDERGGVES